MRNIKRKELLNIKHAGRGKIFDAKMSILLYSADIGYLYIRAYTTL